MLQPMYRLARRRRRSAASRLARETVTTEAGRMLRLNLVPVRSIVPWIRWSEEFFLWLDAADTWKAGGGDKYTDRVEQREQAEQDQLDRQQRDELEMRAGSSYRALKLRTGQTVFVGTPQSPAVP
jgi:hypothetical protein